MWVLVASLDHQPAEPHSHRELCTPHFARELATATVIAASLFQPKAASVTSAADSATVAADAATLLSGGPISDTAEEDWTYWQLFQPPWQLIQPPGLPCGARARHANNNMGNLTYRTPQLRMAMSS